MKLTVIIPVYNTAPYLDRCISSVMAQTYTNLEIICVNDGSTDGSALILDSYANKDSRIRVIHQSNSGVSSARNAGIEASTGDYITFVDSDDAIEADMYEILLQQFTSDEIDIVHCGYKRMHSDGSFKEVSGTGSLIVQSAEEATQCLLLGKLFVGSLWNKIYRRSLFDQVRFDPSLAINEDVLLNAEAFMRARKILFWDICKYQMFERQGSATTGTQQEKKDFNCIYAAKKINELCKGTSVESAAAERLFLSLVYAYRNYILTDMYHSRTTRLLLARQISSVYPQCASLSHIQKLNYHFMRFFPLIYKLVYSVYDKVRVPNWDV